MYSIIGQYTSINLNTLISYASRCLLFGDSDQLLPTVTHIHAHIRIHATLNSNAMESIEEQWNAPTSTDILSDSWVNIADAKKAVKIWILDRSESWAPSDQNNKTRLQLHCLLSTCAFYICISLKKNGLFGITSYTPHNCPPSTHFRFKQRNSSWYLASLIERDVMINRHIKPNEIQQRASIYHGLQSVSYMPAW
jgi:hypothetical protein